MTLYVIANYLHILGAMGIIAVLCIEWTMLLHVRSAETVEQARQWLDLARINRVAGPVSLVALLIAGLYMAVTRWGGTGWTTVGLLSLLLIAALGAFSGIRLDRTRQSLANQTGTLPTSFQERVHQPWFSLSIQVRTALLLAVVYLMVAKPDLNASLMIAGLAVVLGLASALPAWRRPVRHGRAQPTVAQ
jgi:hypothetical protein